MKRQDRHTSGERKGHDPRQVRPYSREGSIFERDSDEASHDSKEIVNGRSSETIISLAQIEREIEMKIVILDNGIPEALIDALP